MVVVYMYWLLVGRWPLVVGRKVYILSNELRIADLDWLTARFAKLNHAMFAKEIFLIAINSF
jgi:hypothetical protein